ncbi:MAG: DUF4034 domain-containing protein [Acidobacteriia bacterium]|nr:DUF4034 domain-containing protein [Terriglobia bacterium]
MTLSILVAILFFLPLLHGQDTQSLGDAARRIRTERNKAATPKTAPADANTATKTAPPANAPAPAVPRADSQTAATGQFAPYATRQEYDLHSLDRYSAGIRALFEQEKFENLDQLATTARSTHARLPGGFWTIHLFYSPLMEPAKGTDNVQENDWTIHLDRLQRWKSQRPDSITARVALAGAQLQFAWRARGGGFANTVSEDGWRVFQERAELAARTLVDASSLPAKCPEWYLTMQAVARALGQGKEMQTAIFEKAVAFEPDYQYFYRFQAETLMPKWEGEAGEMAAFAARIADRIGGTKGDMIYYQIATFLNCACDNDRGLNGLSWPRIRRGYSAVEEQYGESVENLNAMAYMAGMAGDPVYAEELFARIGEGWDENLWHNKENFQMVREWASVAARGKAVEAALKAADDNLQTDDGRKFDEQVARTFAADYSAVVRECLRISGDSFIIPFNLLVQVAKDGAIEKVFAAPLTATGSCLSDRLGKGMLPAPPKPDYWVKVSPQAQP